MQTIGLEQSPAYFSRRAHSASRIPSRVSLHSRTRSLSQPQSILSVDSTRSREISRERSTFPWVSRAQRIPPGKRDSGPASNDGGRSRSPFPSRRRYPELLWKRQMRTMPVEQSKFMWDTVLHFKPTGFL